MRYCIIVYVYIRAVDKAVLIVNYN